MQRATDGLTVHAARGGGWLVRSFRVFALLRSVRDNTDTHTERERERHSGENDSVSSPSHSALDRTLTSFFDRS